MRELARRIPFVRRHVLVAAVVCAVALLVQPRGAVAVSPTGLVVNLQHHDDHDHSKDHERGGWIGFMGSLHPVSVHFPIALVIVAGLAEVLGWIRRRESYVSVARFALSTGAIFAIVSVVFGFAAASGESYEGVQHRNFVTHRLLGVVLSVLIVLTLGLGESARRTAVEWQMTLYRVLLFAAVIVVGIVGFLGGLLVFGPDHFKF